MAVVSVGSVNMDVSFQVHQFPAPGETIGSVAMTRCLGGKGANQAVAAAKIGATTAMVGAVGGDDAAATLLSMLHEYGVDITGVVSLPGESTGLASIMVAHGENMIVLNAGANAAVDGQIPSPIAISATTALMQLEVPPSAVEYAVSQLKPEARLILNAAPAISSGAALFPRFDLLVVNETELATFAGTGILEANAIAERARTLLTGRLVSIIVTLGAMGVVRVDATSHRMFPAPRVDAIDSTGAGDCFCGALAAMLDEGVALDDAIVVASGAASLAVTRPGAAASMPTRDEVLRFLEARRSATVSA